MDTSRLSCTTLTFGGSLHNKLLAMKAAGFGATEFLPRDLYEPIEGPAYVLDLLRRTGLSVSCYQSLRDFEGMAPQKRERNIAIAVQLFEQMRLIGCDTLVLPSNVAADSSPDTGRIVEDLCQLGDLARTYGARVAWEPICMGRWIRDYRDAWKIVQEVDHPQIGLLLDSFHVFALNAPLEPIADIPAEKIFLVEVSDLPGANIDLVQTSRYFRLFPGEGTTPIPEFIRRVRDTGYGGYYSVEVFNTHYRTLAPDHVAARAMAALASAFDD